MTTPTPPPGVLTTPESQTQADETRIAKLEAALAAERAKDTTDEAKLADLQAQIDALKAPVPPVNPPPVPPSTKVLFGASVQGEDPAPLEAMVGHTLGVHRTYWQAGDIGACTAAMKDDAAHGRASIVSFKLPGTWADMAAGKHDDWLAQLGQLAAALPAVLCLHHEPENDIGTGQQPGDYKAMYTHARPLIEKAAPKIALTPIYMSGKYNPVSTPNPAIRLRLEDWLDPAMCGAVGFDAYNHWTSGGTAAWRTVPDTFGHFLDDIARVAPSLPVYVAEWGVRTDPATPGKAAQWMHDAHTYLTGRSVKAMSFFSSSQNVNDGGTPWALIGGDERTTAFAQLLTGTA